MSPGPLLTASALPVPLADDKQVLQNLKRILAKVQEMRDQRMSLEQQLRELIQKDDITTSLVTTDRSEMKVGPGCCGWENHFLCHGAPARALLQPQPPQLPSSLGRNSLRSS